jgi:hypothetical protein
MVHADDAALPENARRFFAALAGPKDLYWTQGTQTDFYDQATHVERAVQLAAEHFIRTLDIASLPDAARLAPERAAIADRIARFLLDIDRQDWSAIRAGLSDMVFTDYTSLFGGTTQNQPADALVDNWRSLLPGFDATQHMLGPIVATITTDGAEAHCAVTGTHRIGDEYWTVGGSYEMRLVPHDAGWHISAITLRTAFVQGDPALPARASARAAG